MNFYIYSGIDIDHVLVQARKQIKPGQIVLYYESLRMEQAIAIKTKALAGNKVILINGNDLFLPACEALLKSIEESKAKIIIATTKQLPPTILSRGILLEVFETIDSKIRRLVFAGVNFSESTELIGVFKSVTLSRVMFNDFLEKLDDFVTVFRELETKNIKEIQYVMSGWENRHFKLLGLIIDFLLVSSVRFGIRKYFFEMLKMPELSEEVLQYVKKAVVCENKNLVRFAISMSIFGE